jgi:acyl-coenzyme A synthetase/AMP-(fatty) acid ligase
LKNKHVALLLDESVTKESLSTLILHYRPNFIFDGRLTDPKFSPYDVVNHQLHKDLALLSLTSGSTASAKLVRLSYKNLQSNAQAITEYLPIEQQDVAITSLPFCYSYGLSVINSHLLKGACLVMAPADLMNRHFWSLFEKYKVTSFAGVPLSYQILQRMRFNAMKFPALRYMTQAGGKLTEQGWQYIVSLSERCNVSVFSMYGQTEATARMAYLPAADVINFSGSIGKAIPGGVLELQHSNGKTIDQPNEEGELIYSGANVMMGYAESVADLALGKSVSCLKTGDIAYCNDQGFYYITGRIKRFIKIAGVRFNLDDIEQALRDRHYNALCTGCDDQLIVMLDVSCSNTADNGDNTEGALLSSLQEYLQAQLCINTCYFLLLTTDKLPYLPSGKPDYLAILREADAA